MEKVYNKPKRLKREEEEKFYENLNKSVRKEF
jgi:hypothetical protein